MTVKRRTTVDKIVALDGSSAVRQVLDGRGRGSEAMWLLDVTRVCNNRCVFCFTHGLTEGWELRPDSFVPMEDIERRIKEGRQRGFLRVNVSGLEATIHPRYLDIVAKARRAGYTYIYSATNGRRFQDAAFLKAAAAAGLNKAIFSIHGHTSALHDAQTRVPGSFKQAMRGLLNAMRLPGFDVEVHCVLNRLNLPHAAAIQRVFEGLGVRQFGFLQIVSDPKVWASGARVDIDEQGRPIRLWRVFAESDDPALSSRALRVLEAHLNDEVVNWWELRTMYLAHLKDGGAFRCAGEACGVCHMSHFCEAWKTFRETGRIEEASPAPCAGKPAAKRKVHRRVAGRDPEETLLSFMDFFVDHCYTVKGRACAACPEDARCPGARVRSVLKGGFPAPEAKLHAR